MVGLSRVNCYQMMFVGLAGMTLLGSSTAWSAGGPVGPTAAKCLELMGLPDTLSQARTSAVPTYTYMRSWGTEGTGNGQFKTARFIALDSRDRVFVTDSINHRVQKFLADGTFLKAWGGQGTNPGQFDEPYGITVDAADRVYVADMGNDRIQKFSSKGGFRKAWGTRGSENGEFSSPVGVLASGDRVYVSDFWNYRVQKFGTDGSFKRKWSVPDPGGLYHMPVDLAMDAYGKLYVDSNGSSVYKYTTSGTFRRYIYPSHATYGVAVDDWYLYATQGALHRVDVLTRGGIRVTSFGSEGSGPGEFDMPYGVAFDSTGRRLFVVDMGNSRIQVWRCSYGTSGNIASGTLSVSSVTAIPTSDGADIDFALTRAANVSARIMNLAGRPVKTLCRSMDGDAGTNTLFWDATSDTGLNAPSGQYLVEITAATEDGQSARALTRVMLRR